MRPHINLFFDYFSVMKAEGQSISALRDFFSLRSDFSLADLKNSYKRLVLLVHPDKGGDEAVFKYVTDCFRMLYGDLQNRESNKNHQELKASFEQTQSQQTASGGGTVPKHFMDHREGFSTDKFNRFFEENKMKDDDEEVGYGHIMAQSSKVREDIDVAKSIEMKKFNAGRFNSHFEKEVKPTGTAVVVYEEPEALVASKRLTFTEIGAKPDDFTSDATKKASIQYTDYMKAHTTTRLIDPSLVRERESFKNIEQFESHREKVTQQQFTEQELQRRKEKEQEEKLKEELRLERVRKQEADRFAHYQRVNNLLSGSKYSI